MIYGLKSIRLWVKFWPSISNYLTYAINDSLSKDCDMLTNIAKTLQEASSNFFTDEGFLVFFDDQIPNLLKTDMIERVVVAPTDAIKYRHDFLGLLLVLKVPYPCHTVTARINRVVGNKLPNYQIDSILVPSVTQVRLMYNTWKQTSLRS